MEAKGSYWKISMGYPQDKPRLHSLQVLSDWGVSLQPRVGGFSHGSCRLAGGMS